MTPARMLIYPCCANMPGTVFVLQMMTIPPLNEANSEELLWQLDAMLVIKLIISA